MSAFVVQDATINRVVSFLANEPDGSHYRRLITETGCDLITAGGADNLANAMFTLNCLAIEQRYGPGEAQQFRPLDFQYRHEPADRVQVYKSLQCWLYQCSEGNIPETSLLFATMTKIGYLMAESIVSKLIAYDRARWD